MQPSFIFRSLFPLLGAALAAQFTPLPKPIELPAPQEVLQAFNLRAGTVQELLLPQSGWAAFQVVVSLGGDRRTLALMPKSLLSADFKLMFTDATGTHAAPRPREITYGGSIAEVPGSSVAATLAQGQLVAHVRTPTGNWTIQGLTAAIPFAPGSMHVVFKNSDVLDTGGRCGVDHQQRPVDPSQPSGGGVGPADVRVCEIALDCDEAFFGRYLRNLENTANGAISIMTGVDSIFVNDVEIRFILTGIFVRTTAVYTSGPDLGCGAVNGLLQEFQGYFPTHSGGIPYDVAHLFTGSGIAVGVIGCAYTGTICTASAYGVTRAYFLNAAQNVGLVAHEIGHNWNANHCTGSSCNIMCATLGGCSGVINTFSASERSEILAHKASRWCLVAKNEVEPNTAVYYRLWNLQSTAARSLDVINDGTNTRLNMQPSASVTGQFWRFTPVAEVPGTYRISCQWRGLNLPIDIVGSGPEINAAVLAPIGAFAGQYWRLTEIAEAPGSVALSTVYRGRNLALSGPPFSRAWLETYGPVAQQAWTLEPALSVEPATATALGSACRGRGGLPLLQFTGGSLPWINEVMNLQITSVPTNGAAILIFGARLATPIDLAFLQSPGCLLQVNLDVITQIPVTNGNGNFSLRLPNALPLVGTTLPVQGAVIDPLHGPNDPLVATSRGLEMRFGLR